MRLSICCLFLFIRISVSYRILAVFPLPGGSHFDIYSPIIKKLVEMNHTVTSIVNYPINVSNRSNYREILVTDPLNMPKEKFSLVNFGKDKTRAVMTLSRLRSRAPLYCENTYSTPAIIELLASDERFDLILLEFFSTDCFLGFVHRFKAPYVGISTTAVLPWFGDRLGNIDNPSYVPDPFYFFSNRLAFFDRVENFLVSRFQKFYYGYYGSTYDAGIISREFNVTTSEVLRVVSNVSLLLVNTHYTFSFARPLVPSIVEIGGIHIGSRKPLPKNIEKFIEESPHGVIYFSLGSMIKGHTFPEEKRKEFLRAFARLPQRVLWKWENETMPGKPENVMIQKWMPQFDILCHPKVKAFISHGGLLGSTEAVHCGVPMVIMPQYGDQHANAKAAEANGAGVILYLNEATEESVYNALQTVLEPSFKEKTMELSARFRDRPMSPIDTAIYWIEYVIRHKGAPHLKTAAVDMPLYQYLLLDVIAFLLLVVVLVSFIAYKILSVTIRLFVSKRKVKQS